LTPPETSIAPHNVPVRPTTREDYAKRIDRVRVHLESHLADDLNLESLARIGCLSPHHFHRVFRSMTGESLGEHLRRVRLERAALLLRHSSREIMDVALAVGYESPAAFSRAFERVFGTSPSAWRTGLPAPSSPAPGAVALRPIKPLRIVQRRPARVSFVRRLGPYGESAPAAWTQLMRTLSWRVWLRFPAEMIGVCHDDPDITASKDLRYDACLRFRLPAAPRDGVAERLLPGGRHAVFPHLGPHANLPETYERIYGSWLPESDERLGEDPAFEVYLDHPERTAPEKLRTLIHLPLLARA
jgi:AraC family transcriptional regulator